MADIALFITHRTRPGKRAAVRAIWERHMRTAIAGNPDHMDYFYCFAAKDGDIIRVFQRYVDHQAAQAFLGIHPTGLIWPRSKACSTVRRMSSRPKSYGASHRFAAIGACGDRWSSRGDARGLGLRE